MPFQSLAVRHNGINFKPRTGSQFLNLISVKTPEKALRFSPGDKSRQFGGSVPQQCGRFPRLLGRIAHQLDSPRKASLR
jgi:hypothetical protein